MSAPRRFDHDEARALYASGEWTLAALAEKYGVTANGVWAAINAYWTTEHQRAYKREWQREHLRVPCPTGCGATVWIRHGRRNGRVPMCRACTGLERAKTVRDDALLCTTCGEWKPDDAFPASANAKARRGRHTLCRDCQTETKRTYRLRMTEEQRERTRAYDRERRRRTAA